MTTTFTISEVENLLIVIEITAEHMIERMNHLCEKWNGARYADMTREDYAKYEYDHNSYTSIASELAFMRGAADGLVEIPDAKPFPSVF